MPATKRKSTDASAGTPSKKTPAGKSAKSRPAAPTPSSLDGASIASSSSLGFTDTPSKRRKTEAAPKAAAKDKGKGKAGKAAKPDLEWYDSGGRLAASGILNEEELDIFHFVRKPVFNKPKPAGAKRVTEPTSSATLYLADSDDELPDVEPEEVVADEDLYESSLSPEAAPSQPVFRPTTLPLRYQRFEDRTALLVLFERNWFPAYLVDFFPVQSLEEKKRRKKDQWEVQMHPSTGRVNTRKVAQKDIMYLDDDRIASCTMGGIATVAMTYNSNARTRAASPTREGEDDPPLPHPDTFVDLPREQQIRLLRPHLRTIIHEQYEPAQWRIDLFHQTHRISTEKLARVANYGDICTDEVVQCIVPELERWLLMSCNPDNNYDPATALHGSERFDALAPASKREFIQLVLVPELIIRLCIASTDLPTLLEHASPELKLKLAAAAPAVEEQAEEEPMVEASQVTMAEQADEPMEAPEAEGEAPADVAEEPTGERSDEKMFGEPDEQPATAPEPAALADGGEAHGSEGEGDGRLAPGGSARRETSELQDMIVATPDIPNAGTEDSAAAGPVDAPNPADEPAPLGVLTQAFPAPAPALAPIPAPAPEPQPEADQPNLTPDELYNLAVRHLHSLAADDTTSRWEYITREIKQTRSLMRDEQGLPDENLSGFEKEQLRLSQQGYEQSFVGEVGRRRKKVRYTE